MQLHISFGDRVPAHPAVELPSLSPSELSPPNVSGSSASFGVKLLCRRCLFIVVKESKVEANRQVMAKKRTDCSL